MAEAPLVAVAIVSWNTREPLRRCLRSLETDAQSGRAEVWVVDNASSDGSAELVRDEFPWAKLVVSEENLGFGRAVNLVAGQTSTPWIALANADVAVRPRALDVLIDAGERDSSAGALAPRLVLPDGSTQHSVFAFPTLPLAILAGSGLGHAVRPLGERKLLIGRFDPDRARRVPWAVAAFLLVRRQAWDAIGGFDERQWMYAEDLDLGWRLHEAGWATRYEPHAEVEHAEGTAALLAWGAAGMNERRQRASYAWMLRRRGVARTRAIAAVLLAGEAIRWVPLAAAARVAPSRFGPRRDRARLWMRLHRHGLAPRRELESDRDALGQPGA